MDTDSDDHWGTTAVGKQFDFVPFFESWHPLTRTLDAYLVRRHGVEFRHEPDPVLSLDHQLLQGLHVLVHLVAKHCITTVSAPIRSRGWVQTKKQWQKWKQTKTQTLQMHLDGGQTQLLYSFSTNQISWAQMEYTTAQNAGQWSIFSEGDNTTVESPTAVWWWTHRSAEGAQQLGFQLAHVCNTSCEHGAPKFQHKKASVWKILAHMVINTWRPAYHFFLVVEESIQSQIAEEDRPLALDVLKHLQLPRLVVQSVRILKQTQIYFFSRYWMA